MRAKIYITLKQGVLDPQGIATQKALSHLGFNNVNNVKIGKFIEIDLDEHNKDRNLQELKKMCEKLLANTVIEDYKIEI